MKKLLTIALSVVAIIGVGCKSSQNYSALDAGVKLPDQADITKQEKAVETIIVSQAKEEDKIFQEIIKIDTSADSISAKIVNVPQKAEIQKDIDAIKVSTKEIQKSNQVLKDTTMSINDFKVWLLSLSDKTDNANKQVANLLEKDKTMVEKNDKLQKENDALKSKENEQLKRNMAYIIMLSVVGMGIGIALIFLGRGTIGLSVVAFSSCIGAAALFVDKFQMEIAIGFGIMLLIALVYLGFKSFYKNKALVEAVQTTDAIKPFLNQDQKNKFFGVNQDGPIPAIEGIAHKIQSKSTIAEISEVRNKFDWAKNATFKTNDSLPINKS